MQRNGRGICGLSSVEIEYLADNDCTAHHAPSGTRTNFYEKFLVPGDLAQFAELPPQNLVTRSLPPYSNQTPFSGVFCFLGRNGFVRSLRWKNERSSSTKVCVSCCCPGWEQSKSVYSKVVSFIVWLPAAGPALPVTQGGKSVRLQHAAEPAQYRDNQPTAVAVS